MEAAGSGPPREWHLYPFPCPLAGLPDHSGREPGQLEGKREAPPAHSGEDEVMVTNVRRGRAPEGSKCAQEPAARGPQQSLPGGSIPLLPWLCWVFGLQSI